MERETEIERGQTYSECSLSLHSELSESELRNCPEREREREREREEKRRAPSDVLERWTGPWTPHASL